MRISRNGIRKLFLTAFLVMTVMVPLTGQASTLLGTYSTGSNFDSEGVLGGGLIVESASITGLPMFN